MFSLFRTGTCLKRSACADARRPARAVSAMRSTRAAGLSLRSRSATCSPLASGVFGGRGGRAAGCLNPDDLRSSRGRVPAEENGSATINPLHAAGQHAGRTRLGSRDRHSSGFARRSRRPRSTTHRSFRSGGAPDPSAPMVVTTRSRSRPDDPADDPGRRVAECAPDAPTASALSRGARCRRHRVAREERHSGHAPRAACRAESTSTRPETNAPR